MNLDRTPPGLTGSPPERWRTPRRTLILSLALNVFLAGILAGGAWKWWRLDLPSSPPGQGAPIQVGSAEQANPRGLRFAADRLAPEHREAFRRGLRQMRRDAAPAIDAARRERVEIARLLAEPTFDRSAIADALARSRLADLAVRERIEVYALDFATTLPASERDRFVDRLEEMGGLRLNATSPTKGR